MMFRCHAVIDGNNFNLAQARNRYGFRLPVVSRTDHEASAMQINQNPCFAFARYSIFGLDDISLYAPDHGWRYRDRELSTPLPDPGLRHRVVDPLTHLGNIRLGTCRHW